MQAARGEVNRVQNVTGLGALGQAGRGAEPDHLAALGGRRVVREHQQPGPRNRRVQVTQLGGSRQRAEVEDRDVGLAVGERVRETVA